MSDCGCNNNYGGIVFAIGMLSLVIVLVNWSNHNPPTPQQIQETNQFWGGISNLVTNFWVHYSTHPTDMLFKGWFWAVVGICLLPISPLIIMGIFDIINFFRKDETKVEAKPQSKDAL